ncbi:THAP domain-containing protein 5 isoform X2 [Perognathus longimembris pacificus]|nr:THAP domain-containing protein 5 isoform X2 [Perognathus longimembris pacificus]
MCLKAKPEESFASNEAKKNTVKIDMLREHTDVLDLPATLKPPAPKIGNMQTNILTLNLIKQDTEKTNSVLETSINQDLGVSDFHTSYENLNSTTITLTTSNSEGTHQSLETQEVLEITTSHLVSPNSIEIKAVQENQFLISTVEELSTNKESILAIFVPTENFKPAANSSILAQNETIGMEDIDIEDSLYKDIDHSVNILQTEHSYCRQDINKEHLWQKVSKLNSKITLLELQEQHTLGRLKSLEALISQLKQENWLSEENIKIIENHFTTYEVTMI